MGPDRQHRRSRPRGFTLTELLIVLAIVLLISAATLPVVLPAIQHRSASEAARLVQATLVSARDTAVRANAPKGVRLLPDPIFNGITDTRLASNRLIFIEPGPDYSEGSINVTPRHVAGNDDNSNFFPINHLIHVDQQKLVDNGGAIVPNSPTEWYWNIRQGEKIRLGEAGRFFTIVGPMAVGPVVSGGTVVSVDNPERFINVGAPSATSVDITNAYVRDTLYVLNNFDDNGDGFIDEMFDGIDNDGDGVVDPGFDRVDNDNDGFVDWQPVVIGGLTLMAPDPEELLFNGGGEYELEDLVGPQYTTTNTDNFDNDLDGFIDEPGETRVVDLDEYTIKRRPVVSEGAREIALPADVVIDLTTLTTGYPQRSRLPVDPLNGYVDLLMYPNGEVVPSSPYGTTGLFPGRGDNLAPFYHFWIAERQDVVEPTNPTIGIRTVILLPVPEGTPGYTGDAILKGERRLVTLSPRTGQIVTNSLNLQPFNATFSNFDLSGDAQTDADVFRARLDLPYVFAQLGQRDSDR